MAKKIFILSAFLLFGLFMQSYAQFDRTIYPIHSVPQSTYLNPGFQPECTWHFGFPALSSFYFEAVNSGFRYVDLIKRRPDDSLYLDMNDVIDHLGKRNYVSFAIQEELVSFGFKIKKKNYVNFSITERFNFRFGYPKDLIKLAWEGNGPYINETADIRGVGLNMSHFRQYAVGYSRIIDEKLTVGGRAKLLFGFSNVWTKGNSGFTLFTEDVSYDLLMTSDYEINTSVPEPWYEDEDSLGYSFSPKNYLINTKNPGFAFDLGASYKYSERWTFGASVNDLGSIHWTTDTWNFTNSEESKEFEYTGLDINQFFNQDDSLIDDRLKQIGDSLADIFDVQRSQNNYWAPLNPSINLSAFYHVSPKDRAAILLRTDIFNRRLHPQLTVSYNRKFGQMFDIAASYSIMNRSYTNIGLGFALNLGPLQLYAMNDNVYGLFYPEKTKTMNIHFGMNFVFGYRKIISSALLPQ